MGHTRARNCRKQTKQIGSFRPTRILADDWKQQVEDRVKEDRNTQKKTAGHERFGSIGLPRHQADSSHDLFRCPTFKKTLPNDGCQRNDNPDLGTPRTEAIHH